MAGKQWRRIRQQAQGIIPVRHPSQLSHTVSLRYCDFKITAFNDFVFSLGRSHGRLLRTWFSIGIGISFMTVIGTTLVLLWDLVFAAYHLKYEVENILVNWLFGLSHFSELSVSLIDLGIMLYSTFVAVFIHEFGHALAAASQGIHIEYIAVFLAIIFPGAFVAFNYDFLQNSTLINSLRIYCAGIWHNVVLCAGCWLTLLFLPFFLYPFYAYGEGSMVLNVASLSPLSAYLSSGDVIVSLDGKYIHNPQEWVDKLVQMDTRAIKGSNYEITSNSTFIGTKGYCVPNLQIETNINLQSQHQNLSCPEELTAFVNLHCPTSSILDDHDIISNGTRVNLCCLIANDIVKLKKCGVGWTTTRSITPCSCREDESCMTPVQIPGTAWLEISFLRPYSSECLSNVIDQSFFMDFNHSAAEATPCGGIFVFVGNPQSLINSVAMSAYRPRWASRIPSFYLPTLLEKVLSFTFHVSASLALFNGLPIFFLDGESILETCILRITCLRLRSRRRVLTLLLYGGSTLFIFTSSRIFLSLCRRHF